MCKMGMKPQIHQLKPTFFHNMYHVIVRHTKIIKGTEVGSKNCMLDIIDIFAVRYIIHISILLPFPVTLVLLPITFVLLL